MAQTPTKIEVKQAQKETQTAISSKVLEQRELGKDFIPTKAGVIPEDVWQARKVQL